MAKHKETIAVPAPMPPTAHISWPKDGVKLSGDWKALGMGKRARIVLEGTVNGFSMQEYGCTVDLKVKTVRVDGVGPADQEEEGQSLASMVGALKGGEKRRVKKEYA